MTMHSQQSNSTISPCLRYRDAAAAIDWLSAALGFEKQAVYTNDAGLVMHAQLTLGGGMIMIGSAGLGSEWGQLIAQPDQIDGRETQCPYLSVPDADAVYQRAKAAGARIILDIKDEDYGGRGFTCADPEGHLWTIGSYDPWRESA